MILRLHHAQISIPLGSENEARAFYGGVLGLKELNKPISLKGRGGLWFELGEIELHLGAENGVDRLATKSHVALEVSDLSFWRNKLEAMQIKTLEGLPIPGFTRFEFRDPFGNRMELLQKI